MVTNHQCGSPTGILPILFVSLLLTLSPPGFAKPKKVSPEQVDGATTVDTAKAKQLFDRGAIFLDVRSNRDWDAGRIPGSVHLELKKVLNEKSLAHVADKNQAVVIYCNSTGCMRSSKASVKAVEWNYKRIYYYRLGYPDWKAHGFAVE